MTGSERSRSPPRHDPQWIARQIAVLGRYRDKRPKDFRVTSDGHMYLDDLMSAWGKHQNLNEEEILGALRKHSARGEDRSRFTITCTVGGRTLIKVSPKLPNGVGAVVKHSRRPHFQAPAPCQDPPGRINPKSKLDMSLDDLIRSNDTDNRYASSSSTKWNNSSYARKLPANTGDQTNINARRDMLEQVTSEDAASMLEGGGAGVDHSERNARIRRKMEQMGLTPESSHIRLRPGKKSATKSAIEIIDGSPSPPPSRIAAATTQGSKNAGENVDDVSLAASAARSLIVSGGVQVFDATVGSAMNEPPQRPPGGNWEQYLDADDSSMWYFWPGPGGEWWCGPNEGDEPRPYSEKVV